MTGSDIPSRPTRDRRPDIVMPDGSVMTPRARLAEEIGISERTIARKNPPTVYIGNIAYISRAAGLESIVGKPIRRNTPSKRRAEQRAQARQAAL